jgi:serine/threonine-protein kinase
MIGSELGGRYELIERIGGGGMALVYKAHDMLLGRKVAVKILRQQFVGDEEFIKRFRREAQAAASLSHPNVVSIYDVGQDGDIHYIIMEYVEGINLNDKIKQQAPLQVEEAVHIAMQICDALDHAHVSGIIHRDIKPHNILLGKNGRVKVTDFGIARAITSADITQTGAVLGSVHYFSPEHAKGATQDAVSDLYSLGIVLYQMLTAKLPFSGESPISVALKHLQEKVEDPRKINPHIPQSVENIVLKALRKNPRERYRSAKEMLADLDVCLLPEKRNEPKWYPDDDEDDDTEKTRIMPALRGAAAAEPPPRREPEQSGDRMHWEGLEDKPSRKWIWVKPVIWLLVIGLVLTGTWKAIGKIQDMMKVEELDVPSVVGMPLEQAVAVLEGAGLTVREPEYRPSDVYPEGVVMAQEKEGEKANPNWPIGLTVSSGPSTLEMDDYVNRDWTTDVKNAMETLALQGVQYRMEEVVSEQPEGTVVGQFPDAGTRYDPKVTELVIQVSKGPGTVEMIDVTNQKESVAISMLQKAGFENVTVVREKAYAPKDYVFRQWPYEKGDLADPEDQITLHVSDGLPDEAVQTHVLVTVRPEEGAEKSRVVIKVTDAYGVNVEYKNVEITDITPFTVTLVLAPGQNGVVTVYRNDVLIESITKTYGDALYEMNPDRDLPDDFEIPDDANVEYLPFDTDESAGRAASIGDWTPADREGL